MLPRVANRRADACSKVAVLAAVPAFQVGDGRGKLNESEVRVWVVA